MVPTGLPESLLVPVETTNREFDGKLLFAMKALQRGYKPVIGSRTAMHEILPRFPRSIYVAKGARSGSSRVFSLLEALGHVIVALDEEALVRFADEAFHMKLDQVTFNRPRLLYAWGQSNAKVWRSFNDYSGAPILEVGNPRLDMMRPEIRGFYAADCDDIRRELGRYIMISSNFAFVNHFIPNHVRHRVVKTADKAKSDAVKSGFGQHKQVLFDSFLALVPVLAKAVAPHVLLIRPHPSENATAWKSAAEGLENVHVIHRGPITPWLMAADALVHNGCTSGIEAAILGTKAFAYRPVTSSFDLDLPNEVSQSFGQQDDLIAACQSALDRPFRFGEGPTRRQAKVLGDHVASLQGDLTCDRILDSFEIHRDRLLSAPVGTMQERLKARMSHVARNLYRAVVTRMKASKSSALYTSHKFPDMLLSDVEDKAARLSFIAGLPTPRFDQVHQNIFSMSST